MDETCPADTSGFRAAVCAWLEADGWVVRVEESPQFPWLAIACQEESHLVVAAPAAAPDALVLSHFFTLEPADRWRIDRLPAPEQAQLASDLLSHLNLLRLDYVLDRAVPHEILLLLKIAPDGLTRHALRHCVLRLGVGLRMVLLSYAQALAARCFEPAEAMVH